MAYICKMIVETKSLNSSKMCYVCLVLKLQTLRLLIPHSVDKIQAVMNRTQQLHQTPSYPGSCLQT